MNFWNGTPSERIWKVGTKRILGVSEQESGEYINLPEGVESRLSWDKETMLDDIRVNLTACGMLTPGQECPRPHAAAYPSRSTDLTESMSRQGRI
jgi:hypothetical protein